MIQLPWNCFLEENTHFHRLKLTHHSIFNTNSASGNGLLLYSVNLAGDFCTSVHCDQPETLHVVIEIAMATLTFNEWIGAKFLQT